MILKIIATLLIVGAILVITSSFLDVLDEDAGEVVLYAGIALCGFGAIGAGMVFIYGIWTSAA